MLTLLEVNLGSVSKTVVGLALIKAGQDGLLSLDSPINEILPFDVINPYHKDEPILVKHLANHTSSVLDSKFYGHSYILNQEYPIAGDVHLDFLNFLKSQEELALQDFTFQVLNKQGKWYKKSNFLKSKPALKTRIPI